MSTEAKEKADDKVEGKKAGKDAPPVNLGWDSHKAVVSIDDALTFSQNDVNRIPSCVSKSNGAVMTMSRP